MGESSSGCSSEQDTDFGGVISGKAVPIVDLSEGGGFEVDKEELRRVLLRPGVQDKPLVVVSVAGAFRKGKSFLLNFFLRYMGNGGRDDWLGSACTPLDGFSWCGGVERHTTGILIWDEVFLVTRPNGSQVAVLLMDTQGAFDTYTTVNDVATIFALSTLTSSVQVYNLSQNIQEDDLQHLQFFAEYGRMAQEHKSSEKPFQKLVFLVRDWAHETTAPHGAEGGEQILNKRLDTADRDPEQQILRHHIKSCFSELCCFLLPYPGRQVANGMATDGCLPEMEDDFKYHLREFVASVLAPDKLVTKRINGEEVSCKEWVTFFTKYAKIFKGNKLPKLKTVLEVTTDVNNEMALNKAKQIYVDGMERECGPDKPFLDVKQFCDHHKHQEKAALKYYSSVPKIGGEIYSSPYQKRLREEIRDLSERYMAINNKKRPAFTPRMPPQPPAMSLREIFSQAWEESLHRSWLLTGRIFGVRFAREIMDAGTALDPHSYRRYRDAMFKRVKMGRPVQILRIKDDRSFELDIAALGRILLANHVKDKPVVVVSLAGAFGTGKSLLLNFLLRYMRSRGQGDWIDNSTVPLGSLSSRGSWERETTGILLWNEVFLVTTNQGQQVAVLFMYTQGAFDDGSTVKDCGKIFALSTLTSSVQVYNLSQNIQEDDFGHLELFIDEYERRAQQEKSETSSQKLLFLVRDWCYPEEAAYGAEGGQILLDRRLQISQGQLKKLKELRRRIRSCFTEISCFLMPHPGQKVASTLSFGGPLSDIEDDFKKHLQELVPSIAAPENLLVKKLNGKEISCEEWMNCFLLYVNAFKEDKLPDPESRLEDTAEANSVAVLAAAKDIYTSGMEQACGEDQLLLSPEMLEHHHLRLRESAREWFTATCNEPDEELSQQYLDMLTEEIDQMFESYASCNKRKEVLAAARTLTKLCAVVLVFFFVSCAFALVGLPTIANFCNLFLGLSLIRLCLWTYVRYGGRRQEVGADINTIANIILARLHEHVDKAMMQERVVMSHQKEAADQGTRARPNLRLRAH